jgi:diguanylate cyclase (GGDEF)-like protein/putative nucleotidyltransferase with HDIG domain
MSARQRDGGPLDARGPARQLQRLEYLQAALLVAIALIAAVFTIAVARTNLNAGDRRTAERELQDTLVEIRDRLRVEYTSFLERRARGEDGTTTRAVAAVDLGVAVIRSLAEAERDDPDPAEKIAVRDSVRAFEDLAAHVRSVQNADVQIGSPADVAALARFQVIGTRTAESVQRWIDANYAQVLESERSVAARTRALMVWLPTGLGLLMALGLVLWFFLDRARRRVVEALAVMAGDQSILREVATRVAQESDPQEVLTMVARAAAEVLGFSFGIITRFADGKAERVGVWSDEQNSLQARPPELDLDGGSATAEVYRTRRPAVVRYRDGDVRGVADLVERGYEVGIAVPVFMGDAVWGAIGAASTGDEVPTDATARLGQLADLVSLTLRNAEERRNLTEQATVDPLTGLANHRTFQERLAEEVARATRNERGLSLVLMDIDHFKDVNDTFGHQVGDEVLVQCAQRLSEQTREGELLARIGGEEFAWLLPEADGLDAWQAGERARRAVSGETFPGVGYLTLSAGVCDIDEAKGVGRDLLRFADGALYWAKAQGRNATYRYTPEVVEELSAHDRAERLARTQALTALQALARAVDARDASTRRHSERVAGVAAELATELGWEQERVDALRQAGLMHDVGKLAVPDAVLLKPGRLMPDEYEIVKTHAERGAEIVAGLLTDEQVAWVRHHHEQWDGSGYPAGIAGANIPDGAQLLALADAWDVMTSERSYSAALSEDEALEECRRHEGSQFAPGLVGVLQWVIASAGTHDVHHTRLT